MAHLAGAKKLPIRQSPSNAARLTTTDGLGSLVHYGASSAFNPKHVVLSNFTLTGDYNLDGTVNAADYVLWRDTSGNPTGYNNWRSHFGLAAGEGSGESLNSAVPEPAAWQLTLAILIAAVLYLRRSV